MRTMSVFSCLALVIARHAICAIAEHPIDDTAIYRGPWNFATILIEMLHRGIVVLVDSDRRYRRSSFFVQTTETDRCREILLPPISK